MLLLLLLRLPLMHPRILSAARITAGVISSNTFVRASAAVLASAAAMLVMMPPVVMTPMYLQLQDLLFPALQSPVVYVLHHHEHICYHKVPAKTTSSIYSCLA